MPSSVPLSYTPFVQEACVYTEATNPFFLNLLQRCQTFPRMRDTWDITVRIDATIDDMECVKSFQLHAWYTTRRKQHQAQEYIKPCTFSSSDNLCQHKSHHGLHRQIFGVQVALKAVAYLSLPNVNMSRLIQAARHTSRRLFSARASATRGVVTTSRKEKKTVTKKKTMLLRPTAPS